jgi:hypothetical protein
VTREGEDEARLDRFLDDPREERPTLADVQGGLDPATLRGRCSDCGVGRLRPDGPCGLGGPGECPIHAFLAAQGALRKP